MPVRWLTESEQRRLTCFPDQISENQIVTFYTLNVADRQRLANLRGGNRFGFALQLGTLRHLGFVPENLTEAPAAVIEFLARQISAAPGLLAGYGSRSQTRTDHLSQIEEYLGFHKFTASEETKIDDWLTARAVEHDRPLLLLQMLVRAIAGEQDRSSRFERSRTRRHPGAAASPRRHLANRRAV